MDITNKINDLPDLCENEPLIFYVNGKKIIEPNPDPETLLVTYLREKLHLTGTKIGCSEGGCGACTVMISKYKHNSDSPPYHYSAIACLTPLCAMQGLAITTIEGIGSIQEKLHPVQERLAKAHGLQCGFCTPGIVMSMYALLRNNPSPSMEDLERTFQGNLCRCTGYRSIIEGYRTFTKEFKDGMFENCPMGAKCCKKVNGHENEHGREVKNKLFDANEFKPYNADQEIIFPPALRSSNELNTKFLVFKGPRVHWYRPVTLQQLKSLKKKFPHSKIIGGNTEIGLELPNNIDKFRVLIATNRVHFMNLIEELLDHIRFGANFTLPALEIILKKKIIQYGIPYTRLINEIVKMLHWFSGTQVRNVATVVGNIMTGSPISDLNPIFLAAGIELQVIRPENAKNHWVKMDSNFFTGYRRNVIAEDEVVLSFLLPCHEYNQYFRAYKQSKRRDDDIAIVNIAIKVELDDSSKEIKLVNVAVGGVADTTIMVIDGQLPSTTSKKTHHEWDNDFVEDAIFHLKEYFNAKLKCDAPGGEAEYRKTLVLSLFYQGYVSILIEMNGEILPQELSITKPYQSIIPKSSQLFEKPSDAQAKHDPIGRPEVTLSAFKCTSGEAIYTDDIPSFQNELHMSLLFSTKAHAKILKIDPSDALAMDGVKGFFSAKDLTDEQNKYTLVLNDERVFKDNVAECNGQVLGAIVAKTKKLAQEAIKLVNVKYEEMDAIITLDDAIKKSSFYPNYPIKLENGAFDKLERNAMSLEGTFKTGKQEHFYIEPQSVIVVPKVKNALTLKLISQTSFS